MIKFGTIGTSSITEEFVSACKNINDIKISCVYSRSIDKAKLFILKNNLQSRVVDNFDDMIDYIDAVYIASPNGLHYQQAKYFLQLQKHVFVEKPMTFTYKEAVELKQLALINNVVLLEAFKPIHLPQFEWLKNKVKEIKPFLASLHWNKYSSRMKSVLVDEYPTIFDEYLGKGSLYDALIYSVELAIALFGKIKEVKAMSHKLKNGVDINNIVLIRHDNNILTSIVCSKAANGIIPSEILSYDHTITFEHLTSLNNLKCYNRINSQIDKYSEVNNHSAMYYEIMRFINIINDNDIEKMRRYIDYTIEAIKTLEIIGEIE